MQFFIHIVRRWAMVALVFGMVVSIVPATAHAANPYILNVTATNADGSYKDGDTINITVQYSEPVTVTGNPFLNLNTGSIANYAGGTGTDTLTFDYFIAFSPNVSDLDAYQVNLNGGSATITDTATGLTNAATEITYGAENEGSLAFNKNIVIDNMPPTLQSAQITGPHTVVVTFSETVLNNTSGAYSNFGGALAGKTITGVADNSNSNYITLTFDGAVLGGLGDGTLDISTVITDTAGNAFAGISGAVVAQDSAPYLQDWHYYDLDLSGDFSEGDKLLVTFDKRMDTSTITGGTADTRFSLPNGLTFGTLSSPTSVAWDVDEKTVAITFGAGVTLENGTVISPSTDVKSFAGTPASSVEPPSITADVWYAEYWNTNQSGVPTTDFLNTTPDLVTSINATDLFVDWGTGNPGSPINSDQFGARFTKRMYFSETGTYRFNIDSDDGVLFSIDDGLVLSAWQIVYAGVSDVFLTEGYHTLKFWYFENDGFAHLYVTKTLLDIATETPTFELAPAQSGSATTYYNSEPLQFSFVLPEPMSPGSLILTFTPISGDPIVFGMRDAMDSQTNPFSLTAQGGFNDVEEILTASASSIPNGTYDITLSYGDQVLNPAATATISGITITDAPQTTANGGIALVFTGGAGGYVPSVGSSIGSSNPTNTPPTTGCLMGYKFSPTTGKPCTTQPTDKKLFTKDLKLGMDDEDVLRLQQFLNTHGYPVAPTGPGSLGNEVTKFGKKTQQALIKFQKANNITPALGYFGPKTRSVVNGQI